jgi:hypothetical protein
MQSDVDAAFSEVFALLSTRESEALRLAAGRIGIASIAKAHDWAATAAEYGLDTHITIKKDFESAVFHISKDEALQLKEIIEEKSEQKFDREEVVGELVGIDVERPRTYFHLKADDGRNIEGKLADTFPLDRTWAVHIKYVAKLLMVTTVRYATGEERIDWLLAELDETTLSI